ncbi:MAG: alpha/beta hydrolase [Isosphaeraceae bacterium]
MRGSVIAAWALMGLIPVSQARAGEAPLILDVWPGKAVGDHGTIGPERVRAANEAPTPDAKWITNVTRPTISVFRPDPARNAGAAMIVCPGGGYWNLAWDKEGEEVAAWLNTLGITGVVLKYRVPRRPGEPEPLPAPGPLLDAQRAISLVRSRAATWGIDPERIGVVGFSAGGHLALRAATSFERRAYDPIDEIDRASCKPDFAVIAYPGYILARCGHPELSDTVRVPRGTGPVFIVHASDDEEPGAQPEQSLALYAALRGTGVPTELHIYDQGRHGFGVRASGLPVSHWTARCAEWLRHRGFLRSEKTKTAVRGTEPLPEGHNGLAARYPGDRGIADDPAVLFHDDFERGDPAERWDMAYHRANIRITEEPGSVQGGRRALELTVPRQPGEVSNELVKRLGDGHDRIFLRYYSKFGAGFDPIGSSHNGALLLALGSGVPFATPGVRANGRNKFSASYENWRADGATPSPGPFNVYCYHPGQRSDYGDHFFASGRVLPNTSLPGDFGKTFVPRRDVTPELDRWYCFEFMVRANTAGKDDGRIACWLDGRLIADFHALRLRDFDALKINHAGIGLHIKSNPARTNRKWYDDVVIATSYIGPRMESR